MTPEARLQKRDSSALYDSLGAVYLSPADGFDELASTYDQRLAGNPLFALESRAVMDALPDLGGKRVADVGCGTGRYALQLARMGATSVVGIDLSAEMLAVSTRKSVRGDLGDFVTWRRGDLLERLPLADESIDLAVCALTLSFLPGATGAFRELCRVLAPGGILIISDYHPHGLAQVRAEEMTRNSNKNRAPFLRFTSASGDDCRIPQYVHTVSDWFDAARSAGLALDYLAEPVADRQIASTYSGLQAQSGVPSAVIARFRK